MTTLEDQVRAALYDMSDEVRPAPLLERLEQNSHKAVRRHRLAIVSVAAAVVAAVTAGSMLVQRIDGPSIVEPVQRPPKVFRLSDVTTTAPGRAVMAVTLTRPHPDVPGGEHEDPLYLLPSNGAIAVYFPASDAVPYSYFEGLSTDGTRLIRQEDNFSDPRLELLDLVTGRSHDFGGRQAFCPQLSPDNATVAAYGPGGIGFLLFDVGSGTARTLHRVRVTPDFPCGGLGWSPDGRRLVVRTDNAGSAVIDRQGTVLVDLPRSYAINNSMSWSPDGRLLLMYNRLDGDYEVVPIDGGQTVMMRRPIDAQRPLGWTGARVVWLAGEPGDYRLVTTDQHGENVRVWMRFDIGDRPISAISWSRDLSGTARD